MARGAGAGTKCHHADDAAERTTSERAPARRRKACGRRTLCRDRPACRVAQKQNTLQSEPLLQLKVAPVVSTRIVALAIRTTSLLIHHLIAKLSCVRCPPRGRRTPTRLHRPRPRGRAGRIFSRDSTSIGLRPSAVVTLRHVRASAIPHPKGRCSAESGACPNRCSPEAPHEPGSAHVRRARWPLARRRAPPRFAPRLR